MIQYWLFVPVGLLILLIFVMLGCYLAVRWYAAAYLYSDPMEIPYRSVILVLGTAQYTSKGGSNHYFTFRMDAAKALYMSGKAQLVIVSGADKHSVSMSEADAMKAALLSYGLPEEAIIPDPAGYRTWDSLWICSHRFRVQDPIVVSQRFHTERAIFIGRVRSMQPIGFNARRVGGKIALKMFLRECLARVKCVLDCFILNPRPVYMSMEKGDQYV